MHTGTHGLEWTKASGRGATRWLLVIALAGAACSPASRRRLQPVALPDLSRAEPAVQQQVREQYAVLQRALRASTSDAALAAAYGRYGMVLHAAEFFEAAEPAYLNAQALAP